MTAEPTMRSRRLGSDCLRAIRSRLGVARRLLDAARSRLSRSRGLLSLGRSRFGAGSRLVGTVGRVYGALRGVGLIRRAACQQRKG